MKQYLKSTLLSEKDNWPLFVPVFFGIGVAVYFGLKKEPDVYYGLAVFCTLAISTMFLAYRRNKLFWLGLVLSIASAGFLSANIRAINVDAPILAKETGIVNVLGTIEEIKKRGTKSRFILKNPTIENMTKENTPVKIRINVNTDLNDAAPGDVVSFMAALSPPPIPVVPGGYDFAKYAFFEQIGAVGYSISDVEIISKAENNSFRQFVENLRYTITNRITSKLDSDHGNIAAALLVGEKGGISKKTMEKIRDAGLAHLLAISGMHLSLFAAIFFILTRALLSLSETISLRFSTKKVAALIAVFGSLFYLLISGVPISAQRACVMTSIILFAIMLDRNGTPLRSVALAALLILIFTPESITTPSFQMSFSAVIALIVCFEYFYPLTQKISPYAPFRKILIYVSGTIMSSVIAGIATAPFSIYHFNNISLFGMFANLIAIPATSLIIMPFGVLSLILMPFSLEKLALIPMSWGIDIILKVSDYIHSVPNATLNIHSPSIESLSLIVLGTIWLSFWKKNWRFCGVIPILFGILLSMSAKVPDFIIDSKSNTFAVLGEDDNFIFSSKRSASFAREVWLKKFGIEEFSTIKDSSDKSINCDSSGCIYKRLGYIVAVAKQPDAIIDDCQYADIFINLTGIPSKRLCDKEIFEVSQYDMDKKGTYAIYLNKQISVDNVRSDRGERLWVKY